MVAPLISATSRAAYGKPQHHTLNWSIHNCWIQNRLVVRNTLKVDGEIAFPIMILVMVGREEGKHKEL